MDTRTDLSTKKIIGETEYGFGPDMLCFARKYYEINRGVSRLAHALGVRALDALVVSLAVNRLSASLAVACPALHVL